MVNIDSVVDAVEYEKLVYEMESDLLNADAWPEDDRDVLE